MSVDNHNSETISRRGLLNGLVTAATKPWRHGQHNGHTSNAVIFPTVMTAVNAGPACRPPATNSVSVAEEQRRRLQQQRNQDRRLNVLWYGGDDLHQQQQQTALLFESHHNRYQPAVDDWEKQQLRKRRRKSERSRHGRDSLEQKRPAEPFVWAVILYAVYAASMAVVYFTFGITGSGWLWLRGIIGNADSRLQKWLCRFSPSWYYVAQTCCAFTIGCLWYRCFHQRKKHQLRHRWWCYALLVLFTTALLPSVPLAEIFNDSSGGTTAKTAPQNPAAKQQAPGHYYNTAKNHRYDNRLILYEGLWQMMFFIFVAYCFVLPINSNGQSYNENNNDTNNVQEKDSEDHCVTKAVLLFTVGISSAYTTLNAFTAYCWYCQHHRHQDDNDLMEPIKQQLVANIVALTCINLTGWLLRQHVLLVRLDIGDFRKVDNLDQKNDTLHLELRWQADKLNRLLTSLVPKRVFLEMKYDIVADAARSYYTISDSNDKDDNQYEPRLQRSQQDIQLLIPQLPKMYLKEYESVSVVYAKMSGFWYNTSPVLCHGESGSQSSCQVVTLIDRVFVNLFNKLARRNHCLPVRLLGQRIVFVAGLPAEESYGYNNDECDSNKWMIDDYGHAKNAIQMGLDLINGIDTVVHDVSRSRRGHRIDLKIRVGVHSGRVTCGVLGFTGGLNIHSDSGSRWKYDVWGRDVQIASSVESSGRPGRVHVSRATVDRIAKNEVVTNNAVVSHHAPRSNFHNGTVNYSPDYIDTIGDYTFERNEELRDQFLIQNHIDTYFVVPNVPCTNSEMNEFRNPVRNRFEVHCEDNDDNYSGEDTNIVSLIFQSVEHQLQAEETRRRQHVDDPLQEIEMAAEQLLPTTTTTTAVVDLPVTTAALITAAPITAMMIMNRHRRSRYEQEPIPNVTTIPNTCTTVTTTPTRSNRWEDDVFKNYDRDNIKSVSTDSDIFRLAITHLLLLCVVIALFVVNMTTMPWTLLLAITFIIPFVIISGELIYVMALLIDWVHPPRVCSNTYITAIMADDNEYYQHYDSDHYSDSSGNSDNIGCLRPITDCCCPNRCWLFTWFLKPFQWRTSTTENPLDDNNSRRWWFTPGLCHCGHRWPTWCLNNESRSSWISSDESDIESRPGFRNQNAILASTSGVSSSHHLQNRLQHSQTVNINRNSHKISSRMHQRRRRPNKKYQDEMRCTGFFWLSACCEMFVVLLVCLLALLNAFTCEPVVITATENAYNESISGVNTLLVNSSRQHRSPLTCQWPQYAVISCCLACLSIAIAFPIYYGSLPTLWMKITVLFVMICVFPITFIHFTHRHVFFAASVMSVPPTCCNENVCPDLTGDEKLQTQNQELQQQSANLITVTATVYVIIFTMAILIYSIYTNHLKTQQAIHRVKTDRDMRRLKVLRAAHRRTLRTIVPDHVADSLRENYSEDTNNSNEEPNVTWHKQSRATDIRPVPIAVNFRQSREHIQPLYHRNYQSIVVVFATIIQDQFLFTTTANSALNDDRGNQHHQQLVLLHEIFSEFDKLLDNQKFRGLVEKVKMVGTNTYMMAVGLQKPEHLLLMQQDEIRQRTNGSCHKIDKDRKKNVDCTANNDSKDIANEFALYDVTSANYVIFALDFVREMRRALHRWQTTPVTSVGNLHLRPARFTLRVGLNVGPAVAGLIGCNDGIWKRPQFDIWGSTVNVARQMDTTGVPGSTQVTNCVVEVMKSVKDPEYEFEIRTQMLNKGYKRLTYFVRENFERHDGHQQQISNYHQQQHRQIAMGQKTYHQLPTDSNQQQWHKNLTAVQQHPPHNVHRTITQQSERDQPSSPLIQHTPHSYYAKVPQKSPPPPPPSRSPPPANVRRSQQAQHYPMPQHQCSGERDRHSDQLKRSRATGIQLSNDNKQQYYPVRHTPDANTKPVTTYARPLQQQQKNNQLSSPGTATPVPRGLVLLFGDDSQQPSSIQNVPIVTNNVKSKFSSNVVTDATTHHVQQQLSQPRRPNMLALRNTTAGAPVIIPKKFDADRPLPAPPRSSDTVAGRQRNHHDPRRRRRQQNQSSTTSTCKQLQNPVSPDIINNDRDPVAWPSSSAFRSPVSVETFISTSSVASSLSSSGSTDAGGTTTSNNNYNTTTTASSSDDDDSFGRTATEDGGGINRVDIEDFDTAASSVALSPVHRRYQHQQQHVLLRQWSPSTTTANSSPVKRSSSFRSPMSGGDNTAASSSSLRSPPVVENSTTTGFVGTQSLNRRRMCTNNGNSAGGGSSSSRRRRRRQQQQQQQPQQQQQQQQQQNNAPSMAGQSSSPSSSAVPEIMTLTNTTGGIAATERYESPPLSPWKKQQQQQRRQITSKDQGTSCVPPGPDFTDEIRRILLLDQHRGNVRQQQEEPSGKEVQINKHQSGDNNDDKKIIVDEVVKQPSLEKQQAVVISTTVKSRKHDKGDGESNQQNEKNVYDVEHHITTTIPMTTTTNVSSASSFEERERQITEQVKRQQAEVRRILQEHKNNVVSVVRGGTTVATEAAIHGRRKRVTATTDEFSEWSDDESVDPSSSLVDNGHREQCVELSENTNDYAANRSVVTADTEYIAGIDCDGYTTGGDGDGYTTTGYTTDEAAATADVGMEMVYATAADSPIAASVARHLDDNLSTINDTGLTDAEGALSDVNSMIYYNDHNEKNHYGSRRQSSLSSRYASDSYCDDDDDDDDDYFHDNNALLFRGRYDGEDEEFDLRDDGNQYSLGHIMQQQQQLSSTLDTQPEYNKRLYTTSQTKETEQSKLLLPSSAKDSCQKLPIASDGTAVASGSPSTTVTTTLTNNNSSNTHVIPTTTTTTTSTANIDQDELQTSSTNTIKDNFNLSHEQNKMH